MGAEGWRRRRGITLIELVVVALIFSGLLTAFVMIQMSVRKQQKLHTRQSESEQNLALTMEATRKELRGARLVRWDADELFYRVPVLGADSRLLLGSDGLPQYQPSPGESRLSLDADGWLRRSGAGEPRRLGRLGNGSFEVSAPEVANPDLLRLRFRCLLLDYASTAEMLLYFDNQL